ncbi:hypothetical protein [Nonlabens sp. YIK11]|uniref:hypothetical protein n=1 Tax=Nonlabens sp. YIK11 TaxID=1453349 RepID=UPI000AC4212C|nr:hypothetical protein [Nonlabens sp. YIK11]
MATKKKKSTKEVAAPQKPKGKFQEIIRSGYGFTKGDKIPMLPGAIEFYKSVNIIK